MNFESTDSLRQLEAVMNEAFGVKEKNIAKMIEVINSYQIKSHMETFLMAFYLLLSSDSSFR